MKPIAESR